MGRRIGCGGAGEEGNKKERDGGRVSSVSLELSGGYLLSHRNSTIGVTGLNFSVRNGKRWIPGAIATLYDKKHIGKGRVTRWCPCVGGGVGVYSLLGVRRWYGACVAYTLW